MPWLKKLLKSLQKQSRERLGRRSEPQDAPGEPWTTKNLKNIVVLHRWRALEHKPVLAREREARLNIRALSETCSQRLRQHALDRKSAPGDYAPPWHQLYSDQVNGPMHIWAVTSTSCGPRPRLRRCLDHVQHIAKSNCNATLQPWCTKPFLQKQHAKVPKRTEQMIKISSKSMHWEPLRPPDHLYSS